MAIADLVNALFEEWTKREGHEVSNQDVAKALACDASYIAKLRKGKVANPGRDTLLGLAQFFGAPISYFFPELARSEDAVGDDGQVDIALRSAGLDTQSQSVVKSLINMLRNKREG